VDPTLDCGGIRRCALHIFHRALEIAAASNSQAVYLGYFEFISLKSLSGRFNYSMYVVNLPVVG
jgi:hypothetical protein